jgi:hypothetical protein
MFDVEVESAFKEFSKLYADALVKASKQAVKATANDAIKITLPNTLDNIDKSKPASKQKGVFNKNLAKLKDRIKKDIIGNGMEGDGIPTAIPNAHGEPIPQSIRGIAYMPFMLVAKPKGKKRRMKLNKVNGLVADSAKALFEHLRKYTYLRAKKLTFRQRRKNAPIMWLTKASTAKDVVKMFQARAGNLLSGWAALSDKASEGGSNILNDILKGQQVDREGTADIESTPGKTSIVAYNDSVPTFKQSYQQQVVDSTLAKSFEYHLNNAIKNINTQTLRKQVKKNL